MNLQESIRRILREETAQQAKLKDMVSRKGFIKVSKMMGGIENLYNILNITGSQDDMMFIVKAIMEHDLKNKENICSFEIIPTQHSIKIRVEIAKEYRNLPDDNWGNRKEISRVQDDISNIIYKLGNGLVRGHIIRVSIGECLNDEIE